jgi:hypothetical protein
LPSLVTGHRITLATPRLYHQFTSTATGKSTHGADSHHGEDDWRQRGFSVPDATAGQLQPDQ